MPREPVEDTGSRITVEEPQGFTQVPVTLLLNPEISDGAYRVYALLKHHAWSTSNAFPGRKRLARELGLRSVRSVDTRLQELREHGYLTVTPRFRSSGGQTSNDYHLRFYPVPSTAPSSSLRGEGAESCTAPSQASAGHEPRSSRSTSTPTSRESRPRSSAPAPRAQQVPEGEGRDFAEETINLLPSEVLPRTRRQHEDLLALLSPLSRRWSAHDLVDALLVGQPLPEHVSHPVGLLRSRLENLPARRTKTKLPTWCGKCDERTRTRWHETDDVVSRCPHCHPLAEKNGAPR